jgi:hypothetical protein
VRLIGLLFGMLEFFGAQIHVIDLLEIVFTVIVLLLGSLYFFGVLIGT